MTDKTPQNENEATSELEQLLREVALFLGDLPRDLGRGSLNGAKAQLQQKISDVLHARK